MAFSIAYYNSYIRVWNFCMVILKPPRYTLQHIQVSFAHIIQYGHFKNHDTLFVWRLAYPTKRHKSFKIFSHGLRDWSSIMNNHIINNQHRSITSFWFIKILRYSRGAGL